MAAWIPFERPSISLNLQYEQTGECLRQILYSFKNKR
jgi:hypothetical protein